MEEVFLQELHADATDEATWLALADWLEDDGQAQRAELLRLVRRLRALPLRDPTEVRKQMEARVVELLSGGVRPVVPEVVNSIGMRLALIPPGVFLMGSLEDEEERADDEGPQHEVEISRPFYMSIFPVTQAQWQAVMGHNPSFFCATGDGEGEVAGLDTRDFPVEQVSWEDATEFLKKLSALKAEREAGRTYRLPTEAQWEYACRGGVCSSSPFHYGDSLSSRQANFNGDYPYGGADKGPYLERTCKVGSYRPNAFALFDMHGNVWEWCSDWYVQDYYKISPRRDPSGPSNGSSRVFRGGCWGSNGRFCRAAFRYRDSPSYRDPGLGFRVAAVLSK
jgi:uncharacterized protein (TIGR02996 family)